jgi:hypothetical protein
MVSSLSRVLVLIELLRKWNGVFPEKPLDQKTIHAQDCQERKYIDVTFTKAKANIAKIPHEELVLTKWPNA